MKAYYFTLLFGFIFICTTACNEDDEKPDDKNPTGNGEIFLNSEWVGVLESNNARWNRPCAVNIHDNTTLTIYAMHVYDFDGEWVRFDSLQGIISNIIEDGNSVVTMDVYFPLLDEQQEIRIEDRQKLRNNIVPDAGFPNKFGLNLDRYTEQDLSIAGTKWSGNMITTPGPTYGRYEYPDLSAIGFENADTYYLRNGVVATMQTPQTGEFYEVRPNYIRRGAKVYMSGLDESSATLYPYFGVLLPGGNEMLADTYLANRVPNVFQTIYWYGTPGITPKIHKIE